MIFDLDGTLVQTERLKALSYARAAVELRSFASDQDGAYSLEESEVVETFKEVVGLSRQTALLPAEHVVDDPNTSPDVVQQLFDEQRQH